MIQKYFLTILTIFLSFNLISKTGFSFSQEITLDEETFDILAENTDTTDEEAVVPENQLEALHEDHLFGMWKSECINNDTTNRSKRILKAFFINKSKQHLFSYIAYIFKNKNCVGSDLILEMQSSGFYKLQNPNQNTARISNSNAFIKVLTNQESIITKLKEKCPGMSFEINKRTTIYSEDRGKNCKNDDLLNPTEIDTVHLSNKGHVLTFKSQNGTDLQLTKLEDPADKEHPTHSEEALHHSAAKETPTNEENKEDPKNTIEEETHNTETETSSTEDETDKTETNTTDDSAKSENDNTQ